jgi:hypothetical protein
MIIDDSGSFLWAKGGNGAGEKAIVFERLSE